MTKTRRCYYCKNEGQLKPDFLNIKAKRADEEAENLTTEGTAKADDAKDGVGEHVHTMIVDEFQDFNTGAEDHFFFSQVKEEKFSPPSPRWLLLDSESTIDIIDKKRWC